MLKIDIEGEESNMLNGARNFIVTYRPIIAISVYHSPSDLLELPKQILNIYKDYKLYFRHYSQGLIESVMFFIPKC